MKYFKIFACCKIVRGAFRSVIIDLQRGVFETIPNDLFNIIFEKRGISEEEIKGYYDKESLPVIDEYYGFLIDREYGFWCDSLDEFNRFPDISDEWDIPFPLSNVIVDIGNDPEIDYQKIISQIIDLRIPHLQIRSVIDVDFNLVESMVIACEKSNVNTIQLLIPCPKEELPMLQLKKFVRKNLRINSITFHSAPYSKVVKVIDKLSYIIFTKRRFTSVFECGIVSKNNFLPNLNHYTESKNYNTCLNRKISIDDSGEIRNCPSLKKSFGNIKCKSLWEAFNEDGYKTMWNIKKDDIDVCKDCEFRHMCTDCRAIIRDPLNIYSQPAKCSYNPYIAKWKGEKAYCSVEVWRKNNPG
jgi:SPASM domain peptide maturase of grasp-with-spasm system